MNGDGEDSVDWHLYQLRLPHMKLRRRASSSTAVTALPAGRVQVDSRDDILQSGLRTERSESVVGKVSPELPVIGDSCGFFQKTIDPEQVEDVCMLAMTTIVNLRETASNLHKDTLREYVSKVFELPKSKLKELALKASQADHPDLKLEVNVVRAVDLPAKDANGKSDPYCRLGILPKSAEDSSAVKHKHLEHWKEKGLVREVFQTAYKEATLSPQWNEEIQLSVEDPKNELLVVEVWDSDENKVGLSKIRGIKGLGTFFTDRGGDDFMCRAFYPLSSIPVEGEVKRLPLFSHSKKHEYGSIELDMVVKGTRSSVSHDDALREHLALLRAFVNHESKTETGQYKRWWEGDMSHEAESLLLQHAALNDIELLQQASLRLSVFLQYHECYALKMSKFSELMAEIKRCEAEVNSTCYLPTGKPQWFIQLLKDVHALATNIREVLKLHLSLFNIKTEAGLARIREHVTVFRDLYQFEPFSDSLEPNEKHVKPVIENCIKVAVPGWFHEQSANLMPAVNDLEMHMLAFQGLCGHCLHQCQRVHNQLAPIFKLVGVDYFSLFYVSMDALLSSEAQSHLEKYGDKSIRGTFEVYLVFRDIGKMAQYVDQRHYDALSLPRSHEWFREMMKEWIKLATSLCRERIRKAIELDEAVQVTDDVKFSTSALDTKGFLLQVCSFWKNLDWPLPLEIFPLITAILQNICECALFYASEVYSSLKEEDLYDSTGQFHASEKLCVILNNMHHIRKALSEMPQHLSLEESYERLEKVTPGHGDRLKELLTTVLSSADEDIYNKMEKVAIGITKKLSPAIDQYLRDLTTSLELSKVEAVTPLLDYLTSNLQTLGDHLLSPVFSNILGHLWCVTVEVARKVQQLIPSSSLKEEVYERSYQRLKEALVLLHGFFHADGGGLATDKLENEKYTSLLSDLQIISLSTKELIFNFFSSVADQQQAVIATGTKPLGSLLLSVAYHRDKKAVQVNLLQGSNLPGLDSSGLSDPFVVLTLLPKWHFPASGDKQRSSTQKKTVDPFFNEDFLLPAEEEALQKDGAILLLTVLDYDRISSDDFAGMCVVRCKDLPVLAGSASLISDTSEPQPSNLTLPLFHVAPETVSLQELDIRKKSDSEAADFWKCNKKLLNISRSSSHRKRSSNNQEQLGL